MTDSTLVTVHGDWLVHADRASVYAIVSDFGRMPEHFPKIARSIRLLKRDGDVLTLEAKAGSLAAWLPSARIEVTVTLPKRKKPGIIGMCLADPFFDYCKYQNQAC